MSVRPAAGLWEPGRWAHTGRAAEMGTNSVTNTSRCHDASGGSRLALLGVAVPLWAAEIWSLSGTEARWPASCASPGWSRSGQSARPEPRASLDHSTSADRGTRREKKKGEFSLKPFFNLLINHFIFVNIHNWIIFCFVQCSFISLPLLHYAFLNLKPFWSSSRSYKRLVHVFLI